MEQTQVTQKGGAREALSCALSYSPESAVVHKDRGTALPTGLRRSHCRVLRPHCHSAAGSWGASRRRRTTSHSMSKMTRRPASSVTRATGERTTGGGRASPCRRVPNREPTNVKDVDCHFLDSRQCWTSWTGHVRVQRLDGNGASRSSSGEGGPTSSLLVLVLILLLLLLYYTDAVAVTTILY